MESGIDIVKIQRFEKLICKQSFLNKYFTDYEISYINLKNNPLYSLAGLYACKEAILKAFGVGIGNGISFKDCSIIHDNKGKPYVELNDKILKVMENLKVSQIKVSISHDGEYAIAMCNLI